MALMTDRHVSLTINDNIKVNDFVGNDGNYKILRPIPLDAINRNKETVEQNPGF